MRILLMKKCKTFLSVVKVLILLSFLSACGAIQSEVHDIINANTRPAVVPKVVQKNPIQKPKTYNVALFLPIESQSPSIKQAAQSLLNAASLAYKETKNPYLNLIIYPTDGTRQIVENAVKKAVENKIDLILGPLLAPSVKDVRRFSEKSGIPMIAFSNDISSVDGGLSYLLSYLPSQNISNIVHYAFQKGHKDFAILASRSLYGNFIQDIFQTEVQKFNGRITNSVDFTGNGADFYEKIKEVSEFELRSNSKAPLSWTSIMLADRAELVQEVVPLLQHYKVDLNNILILGTGVWHDEDILKIDGLNGAVFASPNTETIKIFETRYMKQFHEKPVTIASLAYDAVALASGLIKQYPHNPFSVKNITNPNGFTGVGGIFRFKNNGLSERGLSILGINNRAFKVIVPAPNTFVGS